MGPDAPMGTGFFVTLQGNNLVLVGKYTLPETNSSHLKIDPLEKDIPIENHHFQGLC